jgi:hypothetical protein
MAKNFYGDVTVIEKRRLRVQITAGKKPSKKKMLEMLKESDYDDITDEENLEYLEILELDLEENGDEFDDE